MRIDFVITELAVGGAERCLTELVLGMKAHDDQVRVFSLGRLPEGPRAQLVERLVEAGVEITSGEASGLVSLPSCYASLRRWLRDGAGDLCQSFLFHANVLTAAAGRSNDLPMRVGGIRVAEHRLVRCRVERHAVARMQRVVCVSDSVRNFAIDRLSVEPARAVVIPNGVDVNRFDATTPVDWSSLNWQPDADVILFVGRLHPQKGIDLLQQQLDKLAPPRSSHKLLLIGDGPLRDPLRRWSKAVGSDRVQLLGWQTDIAAWMKACRVLVLPSRYEGMANVVLEAMAAARPVVCSAVEGSREMLGDDAERQIFASGDAGAMAANVAYFLGNPEAAAAAGEANRQRVQQHFSVASMVEAYRELYRDLLRLEIR